MKLLVIGSGGREHAIAWRLTANPRVQKVYVAPGNAGTALEPGLENIAINGVAELLAFAQKEHIHLTVVGPEAPLAAGVVDAFRAAGLRIFGPTQACAQLESSKEFAKQFMERHHIPTAAFGSFTDAKSAHAYIDAKGAPIVVKADGLAAGKGVVVAMTAAEAHDAVERFMVSHTMGDAGNRVVIEEFLDGEEASFIVMADGRHVLPLATSQDHKRLKDGDQGPNTGGMGSYSPAPVVTPAMHARLVREVIQPVITGMAAEGHQYTGFLYAGVMIDKAGNPKVLEFNCRLGDPETQPILMRLKSDLLELIELAVDGKLENAEADWDRRVALGVVLAAGGYPDAPRKGDAITGIPEGTEDCKVFHAGTELSGAASGASSTLNGNEVLTAGGRVLCVTALGDSTKMAQRRAYQAVEGIRFEGMQFRSDIGHRAVAAKK